MARTRTQAELVADVRAQIDEVGSTNPTDAEITEWFNQEWAEVYEKMADAGENYFLIEGALALVNGTSEYNLPADHFKTKGISILLAGGQYVPAHRFAFEERDAYQVDGWNWPYDVKYDLWGAKLKFLPTPTANGSAIHYYIPPATRLSTGAPAGTIDGVNGWEMPAIFGAAARACIKLEQFELAQLLEGKKASRTASLLSSLPSRNAGEAPMARVVRGRPMSRLFRAWWRAG